MAVEGNKASTYPFYIRTSAKDLYYDSVYNPFYNTEYSNGGHIGFSSTISGTFDTHGINYGFNGRPKANVLNNCVGWAQGRMLEIYCQAVLFKYKLNTTLDDGVNWWTALCSSDSKYDTLKQEAFEQIKNNATAQMIRRLSTNGGGDTWNLAKSLTGLITSNTPSPGSMMCMDSYVYNNPGAGIYHNAIVERVYEDGSIDVSQSAYSSSYSGDDNTGVDFSHWTRNIDGTYQSEGAYVLGFISVPFSYSAIDESGNFTYGGDNSGSSTIEEDTVDTINEKDSLLDYQPFEVVSSYMRKGKEIEIATVEEEVEITDDFIKTADITQLERTKGTNLLEYPTLVETPYIYLKVGEYTFGTASSKKYGNEYSVTFPNFITGLDVTKINGAVNQYTISLLYKIEAGCDPNLVDRIFSAVGYGIAEIKYGDMSSPNFVYKTEEVLITKLVSNVNFSQSSITYTLSCTSNACALVATSYYYPPRYNTKPSDVIKELLFNSGNKYGLNDAFPGMTGWEQVLKNGWIATDDKAVNIESKSSMDPISYINYLVSCMIPESDDSDSILSSASYYMSMFDDGLDEYGGVYFKVTKVSSNSQTMVTEDVYEVDVGFPDIENNLSNVFQFNIKTDNSWALVYNYASELQKQDYSYFIDNDGKLYTEYSPRVTTSSKTYLTQPEQRTWWTNMTQFPIKAELTIKGLVRCTMLMTYIRINAMFYGQRHISSGLYVVTKHVDKVTASGFRTTLSLLRVAGDTDYISRERTTVVTTTKRIVVDESSKSTTRIVVKDTSNKSAAFWNANNAGHWQSIETDAEGNQLYIYNNRTALNYDMNIAARLLKAEDALYDN